MSEKPNNPWNNNPCDGIWIRKSTLKRWTDSWGEHITGERYWSGPRDYNAEENIVRLIPYPETFHDNVAMRFKHVLLRPQFVRERFEWLGHGEET
jgi:hypothetical protein